MINSPAMIELPELVIWLISSHLSYEDRWNWRVTCKKLNEIIDQRTSRSLHLLTKAYPFERELFHSDELISYADTLHVDELGILKSLKLRNQFSGLLKLTIYHEFRNDLNNFKRVDLNDMNFFKELVHLELRKLAIGNGKLSLRNLQIAFFENIKQNYYIANFELDCPNLKALAIGFQTEPRPIHETINSIRHLHFEEGSNKETYLLSLYDKLKNLSTVCFSDCAGTYDLNGFLLALIERRVCMPSLKQIKLKGKCKFVQRGVLLKTLVNLKSSPATQHIEVRINWKVMDRYELTEMLNRLDEIFPKKKLGEAYNHQNESFSFGFPNANQLGRFKETPILHCLLPGVHEIKLLSNEDVALSKQLVGKLTNLQSLTLGRGIQLDENHFECMLKTWRRVRILDIRCACLKQKQLDLIPNQFPKLKFLILMDNFSLGNFNLEFVAKFKNLRILYLNWNLKKETITELLENCKHQQEFELEIRGLQNIVIPRNSNKNGKFEITCSKEGDFRKYGIGKKCEFGSLKDAIEYYFQNDLFNRHYIFR